MEEDVEDPQNGEVDEPNELLNNTDDPENEEEDRGPEKENGGESETDDSDDDDDINVVIGEIQSGPSYNIKVYFFSSFESCSF